MLRILTFGCVLVHCITLAQGNKTAIRSVRFHGTVAVHDVELRGRMILREGSGWVSEKMREDLEKLLQYYHDRGFYLAGVRLDSASYSDDSSSVDLTIGIHEGEEMRISSIRCRGNAAMTSARILESFETHAGGSLRREVLERDIDALLTSYEKIGHPFARVEVEDVSLNDDSAAGLRIDLSIDEGPVVTIDEVTVSGNRETKEGIVVREARVGLHEVYDPVRAGKIRLRLNRLGIFSRVDEPELYLTPRGGGLMIKVEEGTTNTFDGIIGFAPASRAGESAIFSGIVNVSMRNLFGTARKLDVHWQREDSETQEIAFGYVEPWVLNYPVNLSGSFRQRQQDSTYIGRIVEAKADVLITESLSLSGVVSHSVTIPSATTTAVSNSRTITAGLELQLDTRDDLISPTSGALYHTGYRIGNKKVFGVAEQQPGSDGSSAVQKISIDADLFLRTSGRQVVAMGLHGRQLTSDQIDPGDLYRFGGTNTVRGYRENEFLGSRVAWTNTEYRFLLERQSYFYGFFDAGYFYLPATLPGPASQQLVFGYGIGVRLATSLGNIGVSIAFGRGNSFGKGKLHVGLLNGF
ncbi:MAG TPA: POTRA domain-containing protein [Bacteroidota bacterium]|nr:POTRA domain-containing protein [Bacteroidota bacterium]